ncbi:MAG: hypothetical protein H7326_04800 [Bdellovibrionaceae bacterium]|nr:hypothetical protein [Pseudobdellovibrionaceae bacterium]
MISRCLFSPLLMTLVLTACGVKKDVTGGTGGAGGGPQSSVDLKPREKAAVDLQMLKLKNEPLKITPVNQDPAAVNVFSATDIKPEFLRLRKIFAMPIPYNGWFMIEGETKSYQDCANSTEMKPVYTLLDDHNQVLVVAPGVRHQVSLEKLSVIRVDIENTGACKNIDLKFSVFYGANE